MSDYNLPDFKALIRKPRADGPAPITRVSTLIVFSLGRFTGFILFICIFFLAAGLTVEFIFD
jgi:hypothetical protein